MSLFTTHFQTYEPLEDSKQLCSVHRCESIPHNLCYHCNDQFCSDHTNEHENQCNQTIPYLNNTINKLAVRLSSFDSSCLQQFEQWRKEAIQSLEHYIDRKRHDLVDRKLENLRNELNQSIDKLNNLIEENNLDISQQVNHDLQMMEIKLIELENMRLTTHPLIIEENLVTSQHLFPLPPPHRIIHIKSGNESSIGSNENYLLVGREGRSLCLIDRTLTIADEIEFDYNGVHSICWSSTINRFLIITFNEIFTLDEKTMILEECSISLPVEWWRGTCSNDILYLSSAEWGSSIYEFDLHQSFQLIKIWSTPTTCDVNEIICDLKYNNDFLAIPIFNEHKKKSRLELRSLATMDCLWSVQIHGRCRCCSINGDQWLVIDHDDCHLFHISADGKLLKKDKYEHHQRLEDITTWNKTNIVILTKKTINLHEIL